MDTDKIMQLKNTTVNNPVVRQLTLDGWLVELRAVAHNYPRMQDGIQKLSVDRILLARRVKEHAVPIALNNGLVQQLKVTGLC